MKIPRGVTETKVYRKVTDQTYVVSSSDEEVLLFAGGGCRNEERLREC
jgi:hypothetical protein